MNYYNTTSEENTIACRNNGDPDFRTSGKGEYTNKPPVIKVLCFVNDVMLRAVEMSTRTVYEIIYDGDILAVRATCAKSKPCISTLRTSPAQSITRLRRRLKNPALFLCPGNQKKIF